MLRPFYLFVIFYSLFCIAAFSQDLKDSTHIINSNHILTVVKPFAPYLMLTSGADTFMTFYDKKHGICEREKAVTMEKIWWESEKWRLQNFDCTGGICKLKADGYYTDLTGTKRDGIYTEFWPNGKPAYQGFYIDGKSEGTHYSWYENAAISSISHYYNGFPVDTSISWHRNGQIKELFLLDSNGSGPTKNYREDGSLLEEGYLNHRVVAGNHTYYGTNNKIIQIERMDEAGKVKLVVNYNENGIAADSGKVQWHAPEFPGGEKAWKRFVKNNLHYPEQAKQAGITGEVTVLFIVDDAGVISTIRCLYQPNELLAEEAIRVISVSPNWIPGNMNNRRNIRNTVMKVIKFEL